MLDRLFFYTTTERTFLTNVAESAQKIGNKLHYSIQLLRYDSYIDMKGRRFMRGHIAKKGKRYYIVVDIGTGDERKQKWLSGFESKKDAEKELPRILNELNDGTYIEPSKKKYADFINDWHKNRKSKVSKNTYVTYEYMIDKHIKPNLGHFRLDKLNSLAIDNFYSELEREGKSSATIKKIHSIVRASLEYAVQYQLIKRNPASVVQPPTVKHKDIVVWDEQQMIAFLDFVKDEWDYIVYHLALYTGMRKGEILGLKWSDIDFINNKIRVMRSYSKTGFSEGKTSNARRVIDIDESTIELLLKRKKKVSENKLKMGQDYNDLDLIICRPTGDPVDVRNVNRRFDKFVEKSNLPKIRFHDMRHTHATLMLKMGVPVKVVSERLGHGSIEMTLNTYTHLLPSMQFEAVQLFNKNMEKVRNIYSI